MVMSCSPPPSFARGYANARCSVTSRPPSGGKTGSCIACPSAARPAQRVLQGALLRLLQPQSAPHPASRAPLVRPDDRARRSRRTARGGCVTACRDSAAPSASSPWRWWRRCAPRHDVRRPQPGSESQRVRDNASVRRRQPGAWALCYPASGWRQPKPHLSPRFMRRTAPPTARPRQFSLDVRGTWRDNGPVLSVAACNPHNGHCLNRHIDDALILPGLVQLEISPPTTRRTLWQLSPRTTLGRHPWCVG